MNKNKCIRIFIYGAREREEIYHMIFIFFAVACAHVFV